jgi:hypothetical protein
LNHKQLTLSRQNHQITWVHFPMQSGVVQMLSAA